MNVPLHKSLYTMLSEVYPTYEWLPWKFNQIPKHFWDDTTKQIKFMDWVSKELKIEDKSDWYRIRQEVNIIDKLKKIIN